MYSPSPAIVTLAAKPPVNLREAVTRGDTPSHLDTPTAGEVRKESGRFKQLSGVPSEPCIYSFWGCSVARGGARVNSGPPPDPNALRRERKDDKSGWRLLPPDGRDGDAPAWPLADPAEDVALDHGIETGMWSTLWRTPQAVVWDELGWTTEVALYCRYMAMAGAGDMKAAGEARQWSDRLGLNPAAMLRNRWKVDVPQAVASTGSAKPIQRKSARERRLELVKDAETA